MPVILRLSDACRVRIFAKNVDQYNTLYVKISHETFATFQWFQ